MRKRITMILASLFMIMGTAWAQTFYKPGERKSSFAVNDEVYIYSSCRVNGRTDWTGFITNSNGSASLLKEKPTALRSSDNNPIWIIASVENLTTEGDDPKSYTKITLKNKQTNAFFGINSGTKNASAGVTETFYVSQWKTGLTGVVDGGEMPGMDVWSETAAGAGLNQADIKNTDPIWVVQAGNGKCLNTNGRVYKSDFSVAYPIVFYSVEEVPNSTLTINYNALNGTSFASVTATRPQGTQYTISAPDFTSVASCTIGETTTEGATITVPESESVTITVTLTENTESYPFVPATLTNGNIEGSWYKLKQNAGHVALTTNADARVNYVSGTAIGDNALWALVKVEGKFNRFQIYNKNGGTTPVKVVKNTNNTYPNQATLHVAAAEEGQFTEFTISRNGTGYNIQIPADLIDDSSVKVAVAGNHVGGFGVWATSGNNPLTHEKNYTTFVEPDEISDLAELKNTCTYKLYGERGFMYVDAETDSETDEVTETVKSTYKHSATYDAENDYHHFAIIKHDNGLYYLYNVGAQKFVNKSGNTVSLTDTPSQSLEISAAADQSTMYDWLLGFNGNIINQTQSDASGIYTNYNTQDAGNRWAIRKVSTDFNDTEALAKFSAITMVETYPNDNNSGTPSFWTRSSVYHSALKNNTNSGSHGNAASHVGVEGHTVYKKATAVTTSGDVTVTFKYTGGDHAFSILGVDLVNSQGTIVKADYHYGFTGGSNVDDKNIYTLKGVTAGNYILRYYVCDYETDHELDRSGGTITVVGAKAITDASAVKSMATTLTYTVGNYTKNSSNLPGYYNVAQTKAAENKATAITGTEEATYTEWTTAFVELDDAIDAITVNLPENNKFYRIKNYGGTGYLAAGTGTGKAKFTAGIGEKASSIFLYTDGKLLTYSNGMYLVNKEVNNGIFLGYTETVGATVGTSVEFKKSQEIGKLFVVFNGNRYLYSNAAEESNAGTVNNESSAGSPYRFTIEEVTWLPVAMNTEVGYATLYSPVQLGLGTANQTRVTPYTGTVDGEYLTLTEQNVVPANTGVVLKLIQGATVEDGYVYLPVQEAKETKETKETVTEKTLIGNFAKTTKNGTAYTLQTDGDGVAFKEYTGEYLNGFKAHLVLENAAAQALRIRFAGEEGGTTTIEELFNANSESTVYDLQGRRVDNPTKGIYIVNGKKVVIK